MANKNAPTFCPTSQADWRKWLEKNHKSSESVWLIYFKVKSSRHNLTWSEAVDEALCFGWIDSQRKGMDEERFMQYFCPRKPKSIWSRINKDKVERLIQEGMMGEAGMEAVQVAKENGSWTILDAVEQLIIPEDLESEFKRQPGAKDFFLSLNKSLKKGMLYWIVEAKRKETRAKRIAEIVECAGRKTKPKRFV